MRDFFWFEESVAADSLDNVEIELVDDGMMLVVARPDQQISFPVVVECWPLDWDCSLMGASRGSLNNLIEPREAGVSCTRPCLDYPLNLVLNVDKKDSNGLNHLLVLELHQNGDDNDCCILEVKEWPFDCLNSRKSVAAHAENSHSCYNKLDREKFFCSQWVVEHLVAY